METRPLTLNDAEGGLRLSTQTGWNHLLADWKRIIGLAPGLCMGVFDDHLVATCTVLKFGKIGWVGVFLADQERQRQGLGSKVFEAMLKAAQDAGIERLALDSSDVGRPIYLRYGFEVQEGIERWIGPNGASGNERNAAAIAESDWDALLTLDREVTSIDRERQLRQLASEDQATLRVVRDNGNLVAFGCSRPGRLAGSIGPVVARDAVHAELVIDALLQDRRQIDGERRVAIDLLENEEAKILMKARGFSPVQKNIRMFRPLDGPAVLNGPKVFAATGLGMG